MTEPLAIVIENRKGSYKSFEIENDPIWKNYPLSGVTFPVDYGYIQGYASEDGHDLDVFVGTGNLYGYFTMWRYDVDSETKILIKLSTDEWNEIIQTYTPVLLTQKHFPTETELFSYIQKFKSSLKHP